MGTGTTAMPPRAWGSRWAKRGEGDLPAGSGAEEMSGSRCRAVVTGGAGRDRACAAGSPRAAGRVPRGGRHGRAKRKRLRTKPRWGWSNWCQPISPRRGPETRAVPEGGHLPRHLRLEAARPGPAPPLPAPPAPARRGALGIATGGIHTAWGTPPAPRGAARDPWDPALAKAAGCGSSWCLRHGTVAGNAPAPLPRSFPVAPAMSGYGWPGGVTQVGDVGPLSQGTSDPQCHRPHRERRLQGRLQREVPAAAPGFSPGWQQPPAAGHTGNRGAVPSPGQRWGTSGAGPGAQPRPGPAPSRPGSRPLPSHLRPRSLRHSSPGRSAAPPGGGAGAAGSGRLQRDTPLPPCGSRPATGRFRFRSGAHLGSAGRGAPGPGGSGCVSVAALPSLRTPRGGTPGAPGSPGAIPLPRRRCAGPGRRGAVAAGAGPRGGSGGAAAMAALRRLVPAAARAAGRAPFRGHRLTPADDEMYQRTRVMVLEPESPNIMFIEGYSTRGFTISGDLVVGPCAVLPRSILQWNVGSHRDISLESLSLFRLLEPQIEILVLGTGDRVERLHPATMKRMRECGIAVEVQDTANACATFNFLMNERRVVAAGLIPPRGTYGV